MENEGYLSTLETKNCAFSCFCLNAVRVVSLQKLPRLSLTMDQYNLVNEFILLVESTEKTFQKIQNS